MTDYRHELKFLCSVGQKAILRPRLMGLMKPDAHAGPTGQYRVRSLYFDSGHSGYLANENGDEPREKYRIRIYNGSAERIRLERKEKRYGGCFKDACRITRDEYEMLVRGEASALLYDEERPVLKRFAADILTRGFSPRVIVDYERIAYVEPIANVRITLDLNIAVSKEYDRFLQGDYLKIPLLRRGQHVLEVKFDEIFPGYLKQSVYECNLQQRSFSKYGLGFELLRSM